MAIPNFEFRVDSKDEAYTIVSFTGREAISELFIFTVTVKSNSPDPDVFRALIDNSATFTMNDGLDTKTFKGYLQTVVSGRTESGFRYYDFTLVPHVWKESESISSQIYVDEDVKAIIQAETDDIWKSGYVDIGADHFDLDVIVDYPDKPFTCQYRESNWKFLSRLMEHYGIYYYFDCQGGSTKIIIADHAAYDAISEMSSEFTDDKIEVKVAQGNNVYKTINSLQKSESKIVDYVEVGQFNPEQPSLYISARYPSRSKGRNRIFLDSENVASIEEAVLLAQIRYDELVAHANTWSGVSGICLLSPGFSIVATDGGRDDALLIQSIDHLGENLDAPGNASGNAQYSNTFTCVDSAIQYRPLRKTPKPLVSNIETGTIFAEQNDANNAEIDDLGRYRVEFNVLPGVRDVDSESSDLEKKKVSYWLRMAQPAAGSEDGFFIPLKPGVEVTINFIGGNTDLPVIAGALSNAQFPSHVTTKNPNNGLISTSGLLGLRALGGAHTEIRTDLDGDLLYGPKSYDDGPAPDNRFPLLNGGKMPSSFTTGFVISEAGKEFSYYISSGDEYSGDYVINRRYGDSYSWVSGNTYHWNDEKVFYFGKRYEEDHEIAGPEGYLQNIDLAGGERNVRGFDPTEKRPEQYSENYSPGAGETDLPADEGSGSFYPYDKYHKPYSAWEGEDGVINGWEDGVNGITKKTWGDQVTFNHGRVFNFSGGPGPGGSIETYNYGNGYTEDILLETSGGFHQHYNDSKHDRFLDDEYRWDEGMPEIAKEIKLDRGYASMSKIHGPQYSYSHGPVLEVQEGNTYSETYDGTHKSTTYDGYHESIRYGGLHRETNYFEKGDEDPIEEQSHNQTSSAIIKEDIKRDCLTKDIYYHSMSNGTGMGMMKFEFDYSNTMSMAINTGLLISSETFLGAKISNSNHVGVKVDVDFCAAGIIKVENLKGETNIPGVAVKFGLTDIDAKAVEMKTAATAIKTLATEVKNAGSGVDTQVTRLMNALVTLIA
jgi:type VI secretion system secreted protein VgrG